MKHPESKKTVSSRVRKNFGHIKLAISMPNLIEVQKNSYEKNFLQAGVPVNKRENKGLQSVLTSKFPIIDPSTSAVLEFVKYDFEKQKYDVEECIQRGFSYSAPLKVTLRLIIMDIDQETGAKEIKGIKEQEGYMADIPLMTENGTFIINGVERVVVSQMHRSPGVFYDHDNGKAHSSGKFLYSARIIPYRGSWLDFEFDAKDLIYFRIDRKRKLPVTTLLRALGMNSQEILNFFYSKLSYTKTFEGWVTDFVVADIVAHKLEHDLIDADTKKIVLEVGQKITPRVAKKLHADGLRRIILKDVQLIGKYLASDVVSKDGEVLEVLGGEITDKLLAQISSLEILNIGINHGAYIRNTMISDKTTDQTSAVVDIFRVLRPGEPANLESGFKLMHTLFFDKARYDLSEVGRIKMNSRLSLDISEDNTVLTADDVKYVVKGLVEVRDGRWNVDDIDHLGNRRVRSVGELIENQFRLGLVRLEKAVLERMTSLDIDSVMPHDLVNSKLLVAVIKEFFGTSQLSQFMDQTNPLSEITHKRRISALGPGGLSRDRAGFEVRDVHPTHYGRICPIETPEGQNIGLINSLATYSRINKYGFIESPYRKLVGGKITDEVVYLNAIDEAKYKIAQANAKISDKGYLVDDTVNCRFNENFIMVAAEEVDFIDVTPMQVVSVAASLIPFIENDDANRALMGSNMQRQAVPLIKSTAPLVGTGIEAAVAKDSGAAILALHDGVIEQVDSTRIVLRSTEERGDGSPGVDIYNLSKFQRSNHSTCINQKPLVNVGDVVAKGDVIADGPSIDQGEVALGRNVLIAFLPWSGYNFEDSIVMSEKVVANDEFSSIHIESFEVVARDTRLGPEEVTRDIPGVGDDYLKHLDEVGIVRIGSRVKAGDILVGKVTPKGETILTPEEKLLRAIFGEKASEVKDSSLHVPPGISGTVVEVRVFSRRGIDKDERALSIEREQIEKLAKDRDDELSIIQHFVQRKLKGLLLNKTILSGPKSVKSGMLIDEKLFLGLSFGQLWQLVVDDSEIMSEIVKIKAHFEETKDFLNKKFNNKIDKVKSGDDLPQGALKVVKVFIAMKHKLQPGDKMAGRHGNKGVVSRIVPQEDMPFLEDGTPVDVVLNPLGLPSRMNVGQVLETHLGWAAKNLGLQLSNMIESYAQSQIDESEIKSFVKKIYGDDEFTKQVESMDKPQLLQTFRDAKDGIYFATPVFDGAKVRDVKEMLNLAGLDESGQVRLIDGRTGEYFDRPVTVGYKYLLKLHHLVDDKIHARSIGPYSLVTQQPLGGRSHFGGQRFGEMECWALQAYGAAYTLQEMLTVKSDDITGRVRIYESIVKGDNNFDCGIPESFNVMIKEFRSLCLNIQLEKNDEEHEVK